MVSTKTSLLKHYYRRQGSSDGNLQHSSRNEVSLWKARPGLRFRVLSEQAGSASNSGFVHSRCCNVTLFLYRIFREAPVRFGSVTVWRWNGSSGSGFPADIDPDTGLNF